MERKHVLALAEWFESGLPVVQAAIDVTEGEERSELQLMLDELQALVEELEAAVLEEPTDLREELASLEALVAERNLT